MEGEKESKPFDYVAQMKNMNEASKKNKAIQFKWLKQYEWLCDEYKNVEEEMIKLCHEKNIADADFDAKKDDRSVMPFPITSNGQYGWLAAKQDFNLEKYGPYQTNYVNPIDEITLLPGNIPTLAAGKGLI